MAIAIPVFTTQLEKSKEGTDIANLRSAYAAAQVAALTGSYGSTPTAIAAGGETVAWYNPNEDGSLAAASFAIGQGTKTDGKADVTALTSGIMKYDTTTAVKGQGIKCTFNDGKLTEVAFAAAD